jgi:hypothetical protein
MSLEAWGDDGDADRPYTQERVDELIAEARQELIGVLLDAVEVIKTWHNMGMPKDDEETWRLYYENAPEMRTIREAIIAHRRVGPDDRRKNGTNPAKAPAEGERRVIENGRRVRDDGIPF